MTFYLVKAKVKNNIFKLRQEIESGKIKKLVPYENSLHNSLKNAKKDDKDGVYAVWIEEDYCTPPLAMERKSVLDRYFIDIVIEIVESEEAGWAKIKDKTNIWI
jgi:hypothetical protein